MTNLIIDRQTKTDRERERICTVHRACISAIVVYNSVNIIMSGNWIVSDWESEWMERPESERYRSHQRISFLVFFCYYDEHQRRCAYRWFMNQEFLTLDSEASLRFIRRIVSIGLGSFFLFIVIHDLTVMSARRFQSITVPLRWFHLSKYKHHQ